MKWQPRTSPAEGASAPVGRGHGIAYVHYKQNETYVGMGMEVAVERATGRIKVERVVCAHDCGQIINPDGVRSQVEGSILQTLSRVLMEEVKLRPLAGNKRRLGQLSDSAFLRSTQYRHRSRRPPHEPPLGAGEAACTAVGAALANAVYDATGVRLRTIPFTPERMKAALGGRPA